jgi:hypothetical protein
MGNVANVAPGTSQPVLPAPIHRFSESAARSSRARVALCVVGQLRTLAHAALRRNWEAALLVPVRPDVFLQLGADQIVKGSGAGQRARFRVPAGAQLGGAIDGTLSESQLNETLAFFEGWSLVSAEVISDATLLGRHTHAQPHPAAAGALPPLGPASPSSPRPRRRRRRRRLGARAEAFARGAAGTDGAAGGRKQAERAVGGGAARMPGVQPGPQPGGVASVAGGPSLDNSTLCPNRHRIRLRPTLALRWTRCLQAIARSEGLRGEPYEYVMLTRPDVQWRCVFPPFERRAGSGLHAVARLDFFWIAPRDLGVALLGQNRGEHYSSAVVCRHKCNMHPGCMQDIVGVRGGTVHDTCVWHYVNQRYAIKLDEAALVPRGARTSCAGEPDIVRWDPAWESRRKGCPHGRSPAPSGLQLPELACRPLSFVSGSARSDDKVVGALPPPGANELCSAKMPVLQHVYA